MEGVAEPLFIPLHSVGRGPPALGRTVGDGEMPPNGLGGQPGGRLTLSVGWP